MATISACAVGSLAVVTRLAPVAMRAPFLAMSAAKGPPPLRMFSSARAMAWRMKSRGIDIFRLHVLREMRKGELARKNANGKNKKFAVAGKKTGNEARKQ